MKNITRRDFCQRGLMGAGVAAGLPVMASIESNQSAKLSSTDPIAIGNTGVTVSRIAQGTGANGWMKQSDQTRLGMEPFERLMRHAYENGITFFDLVFGYPLYV